MLNGAIVARIANTTASSATATYSLGSAGTLSISSTTTGVFPIGALNGSAGSILRGFQGGAAGMAQSWQIGGASANGSFAGNVIDGIGNGNQDDALSIVKAGANTQTLSGSNSSPARPPCRAARCRSLAPMPGAPRSTGRAVSLLSTTGGRLVFDYNSVVANDPVAAIKAALTAGQIATTGTTDTRHAVGLDDTGAKVVIGYTYYGDTNIDGTVNTTDFNTLAQNYNSHTGIGARAISTVTEL